ncbi:putative GTP-binding protein 6 [Ciona intestinalis]
MIRNFNSINTFHFKKVKRIGAKFCNLTQANSKTQTNSTPSRRGSVWSRCCNLRSKIIHPSNWRRYTTDVFDETETEDNENVGLYLGSTRSVFVIQPYEAEDVSKDVYITTPHITNPQLELNESVALVETLPDWKVHGSVILRIRNKNSNEIFSKKNFQNLMKNLKEKQSVNSLFVSVEKLTNIQKATLQQASGLEHIFDRYTLVLQIFKLRAKTKEAKLQVALAQLPMDKATMKIPHETSKHQSQHQQGKGSGETYSELVRREFNLKEQRLMKRLKHVKRIRNEHREARKRNAVPIAAVIGYTNAGKTSLIKALSVLSERVQPKDYLFATLDVTAHAAILPNNLRYVLVDTVGFLSKLPHSLIDAFKATMEDMLQADLLIHVRDISHPDSKNQLRNVLKVLSQLKLPPSLLENIIEVRNKVDLVKPVRDDPFSEVVGKTKKTVFSDVIVPKPRSPTPGVRSLRPAVICHVSATEGTGLSSLAVQIQDGVMKATDRKVCTVRVPAVGGHMDWLREHCAVHEVRGSGDFNLELKVIAADWQLAKFTSAFEDVEILPQKLDAKSFKS